MTGVGWLVFGVGFAWWWDIKRAHPWFLDHHDLPPAPPAHPIRGKRHAYDIDPLLRQRLPKD
jgi:hypothetical protein